MAEEPLTKIVVNQHYDESLEVNDSEEVASYYSPTPRKTPPFSSGLSKISAPGLEGDKRMSQLGSGGSDHGASSDDGKDMMHPSLPMERPTKPISADIKPPNPKTTQNSYNSEGDTDDSDSSSEDDGEDDVTGIEGAYDPADYEHLNVGQDIKELFQYITRYTPQTIELEHKLKPFNPDYIPAVGDIDAFLKVPRPDGKENTLGLTIVDEPCAKQSDPTVLNLQLRNISKTAGVKEMQVRSVSDVEKNPKKIDFWIESMEELHRSKPPPTVHYQKSMPDIDFLMQEWPEEMAALLAQVQLPSAELDCSLENYADLCCGLLDIPVHQSPNSNGRIQSLHMLFSLYSAFKQMQHFQPDNTNPIELNGDNTEPQVLNFD